jgi:carbamate kinase
LTAESIAEIASREYALVITHGNGPQVGAQLLRSEAGSSQAYTLPLDVCVAMTQGEIGFILQNSLQTALHQRGIRRCVTTIITQVVVDKDDPAFQRPTKPIGPFYSKETAERKRRELRWNTIEDATRGYRRVVPSPVPIDIIELEVIRNCLEHDSIAIAAGGGGIPVIREDGKIKGVEAVIDKDRVSALLAAKLEIEHLVISTEVPGAYIDYKKPGQKIIHSLTIMEAKKYLAEGQFFEGSMRPKIEAAIDFLSSGGKIVTIADPQHLVAAIDGKSGTRIVK